MRRYHTFRDALSINHAELSADILFRDGLIKNFISIGESSPSPSDDYLLIEKVIRLHNVFQLPDDLTVRELRFATILRDADKLDIIRVNVETPRSDIYGVQEDIFLDSEITDEVYEAKLVYRTERYNDLVRTFCMNPNGYVVAENTDGIITVNGHSFADPARQSENTNFALLVTFSLLGFLITEERRRIRRISPRVSRFS